MKQFLVRFLCAVGLVFCTVDQVYSAVRLELKQNVANFDVAFQAGSALHTIDGTLYLAAASATTPGFGFDHTLYLYRFDDGLSNTFLKIYEVPTSELDSANDAGSAGAFMMAWQEIDGEHYLVVQGVFGGAGGTESIRLYRFNPYSSSILEEVYKVPTSVVTYTTSANVSRIRWQKVVDEYGNCSYYLAIAGLPATIDPGIGGGFLSSLLLFKFGEPYGAPILELVDAVNNNGRGFPLAARDGAISWQLIDGEYYLAHFDDQSLRLHRLDGDELTVVYNVPTAIIDSASSIDGAQDIEWKEINGVHYLAVVGDLLKNAANTESLQIFKFDDTYGPALVPSTVAANTLVSSTTGGSGLRWVTFEGEEYLLACVDSGVVSPYATSLSNPTVKTLNLYRFDDTYSVPLLTPVSVVPLCWFVGTLSTFSNTWINTATLNGRTYVQTSGDGSKCPNGANDSVLLFELDNFAYGPDINTDLSISSMTVDNMTPDVGDTVTFTITVLNSGCTTESTNLSYIIPSELSFVSATPTVGSYDSATGVWSIGKLQCISSVSLTVMAQVNPVPDGTCSVNTATVSDAYIDDTNGSNNSATVKLTISNPLAISLSKSVDNSTPFEGDTVLYFIQVGTSDTPRDDVVVQDILPSGVTFVSSIVSQGSFNSGSGVWSVGDIAANTIALLAITVTVDASTAGMTITNNASIIDAYTLDCYGIDTCFDNATITVQESCSFANVCVIDQLPTGLNFVSASPTQGHYDPYSGNWLIGDLSLGSSAILTLTAQAATGTQGKLLTNCATIKDPYNLDLYSSNNMACVDVQVRLFEADLVLSKLATSLTPRSGDTVTFQVSVTNNGIDSVSDAFVTDVLPGDVTFVSSIATQGLYDNGTGIWTIGSLAVGQSQTLFITVTVNGSVLPGTMITNTAVVGDPYISDPYTVNNTDSITMTVAEPVICDLSITKVVDNSMSMVGDNVTFTVNVQANQVN